jgi:hypothetical protein
VVQRGHCECREFYFFNGEGNENHQLGTDCFVHHRLLSAVKIAEYVSDRMSYIVLRGRWCNIIILKLYAPSEERSDISKDSFAKELLCSYLIIFAPCQVNKCVSSQIDHHGHVI